MIDFIKGFIVSRGTNTEKSFSDFFVSYEKRDSVIERAVKESIKEQSELLKNYRSSSRPIKE